jgi:hypothetical protein
MPPTGMPANTGDVLSATMYNSLVAFTLNSTSSTSYTLASTDQYQVLVITTSASAKDVLIPTDATYNFPTGTAITVLNTGAGACTVKAVTSGTTTVTSAGATSAQPSVTQYKAATAIKTAANAWTVVGAVA